LFSRDGYVAIDAIRPAIWDDDEICYWYRQNLLFFADKRRLGEYPALSAARDRLPGTPLALVHPVFFEGFADPSQVSVRWLAKSFLSIIGHSMVRNLRRGFRRGVCK
jgi:hypothetical protein